MTLYNKLVDKFVVIDRIIKSMSLQSALLKFIMSFKCYIRKMNGKFREQHITLYQFECIKSNTLGIVTKS